MINKDWETSATLRLAVTNRTKLNRYETKAARISNLKFSYVTGFLNRYLFVEIKE